jgi:hypothetical protein
LPMSARRVAMYGETLKGFKSLTCSTNSGTSEAGVWLVSGHRAGRQAGRQPAWKQMGDSVYARLAMRWQVRTCKEQARLA